MTYMDTGTFDTLHKDALKALSEKRLLDLLSNIDAMLKACPEAWLVRERYEKLHDEYSLMLGYVERGIADERRSEIYSSLLTQADYLLACTHHAYISSAPTSYFSTLARRTNDGSDAEAMFNRALVSAPYDDTEAERMYSVLSNPATPLDIRLVLTSGIALSALCIYDWQKVLILARLMGDSDVHVSSRAAVGFSLAALVHSDRLVSQPKIRQHLQTLAGDKSAIELLRLVQLQLFVSSYTKRDSKKMTEEIIPGMMNAMKEMRSKDGGLSLDDIETEFNPDWDAPHQDSGIQSQMRSLIEMQEGGSDTFYTTFSNLVRHQPFWNDAANWFTPFSEHHKAFSGDGQARNAVSLLKPVFSQHVFSDTEKYSLALMFAALPANSMSEQLKEHLARLDNFPAKTDVQEKDGKEAMRNAIRSCVQDLYRFFTLFRFPLPAHNPFDGELLMQKKAVFSPLTSHSELTAAFADYTFREKDYVRTCELYKLLPPQLFNARNYEIWAAASYNLRRYDEAAECLERALLLKPDSTWSLRLLAGAYLHTSRLDDALKALQEWERLAPDDTTMLQNLGECYLRLTMTEQALEKFFKLHYLRPDDRSRRQIAWCSMLLGKMTDAETYYTQLLSGSPTAEDLTNTAHCRLLQGHTREAIELYRRSLKSEDKIYAEPDFFRADEPLLLSAPNGERQLSLTPTDLQLIRDAINRNIQ